MPLGDRNREQLSERLVVGHVLTSIVVTAFVVTAFNRLPPRRWRTRSAQDVVNLGKNVRLQASHPALSDGFDGREAELLHHGWP